MAEQEYFPPLQRMLHWLTVLLVVPMVPMGFYMVYRYGATDFDATTKLIFKVHELIGFLLLWIVVARIVLRFAQGVPPPVPTLTAFERLAAALTHWGIYALLIVIPVIGWIGASAYELLELPFGLKLPAIAAKDGDYAGWILGWHRRAAVVVSILAGLHIAAALMHRFVKKDGVLQRMWPSLGPPQR